MNDMFRKKSWMSPVATASSTGTEEVSDVTDDDTSLSGKCTYYNVTFFCVFHYLRMIENPFLPLFLSFLFVCKLYP